MVVGLVAGYAAGYMTAPTGPAMEHVTFILNWTIGGEQAGILAAQEQGYYAEEGLSVTILRGFGSSDTAERVAGGEGEFGYINMISHIIAEATPGGEIDLISVGAGYIKSPMGVFFKPDTPITEPTDFEGMTVAVTPASSVYLTFIGPFADATGMNVDLVTIDASAPYAKAAYVLSGNADACTGYTTGEGAQIEAEAGGVGQLLFSDYGLDVYTNSIVGREDYVNANPGLVKRFVRATLKGWGWALSSSVNEVVTMLLELYPELEEEATTIEWQRTIPLFVNEEGQQYGLGHHRPEKVENTIRIVREAFDITEEIPAEEIYTNEYVEDLPDEILFPF